MEKTYNGGIKLRVLDQEYDVYPDMALEMLEEIQRNNAAGKRTVMIIPCGPTGQYPIFATLANRLKVSLKNVHFFNMDEYLVNDHERIADEHPMSFHGRMQRDLYDRLDPALGMTPAQRHFPEPGHEAEYDAEIAALGGADLCLGGIGINGHIAFNEPPEKGQEISAEEFAALPTRVLPITRETIVANGIGYQRGDLRGMPEWCITVGMKPILASRRIYIALSRDWQYGITRRVLTGPVTSAIPCSLLQTHGNVTFASPKTIAQGL